MYYRITVLSCFLKVGVIKHFRDILKEGAYRLASSRHLTEMISIIHHEEEERISIILDGTIHVCKAMVIVLHCVDDNWCLQQHVARLMLYGFYAYAL